MIVEGVDDVRIINALCKDMRIFDVQVTPSGGYEGLSDILELLMGLPNFRELQSLAVVVDADQNAGGRRQGVEDALERAGLPRPTGPLKPVSANGLMVSYLVVPHDAAGTMMEDVCLDSVEDDPVMKCVDHYLDCVAQVGTPGPRSVWTPKARVHAFLASRDRPDLRIGEAADSGIWRFESDAFRPLADLLRAL